MNGLCESCDEAAGELKSLGELRVCHTCFDTHEHEWQVICDPEDGCTMFCQLEGCDAERELTYRELEALAGEPDYGSTDDMPSAADSDRVQARWEAGGGL